MSAGSNNAPTIIKRKKVIAGGGHHGGAWKVAIEYGPLCTALCAGLVGKPTDFLWTEVPF